MEIPEVEEFTAVEFEFTQEVLKRNPPEKHLDSPITDGLIRRICQIVGASYEGKTDRIPVASTILRRLNTHVEEAYSNIRPPVLQMVSWMTSQKCTVENMPKPIETELYPELFHTATRNTTGVINDMDAAGLVYDKVVSSYLDEIRAVVKPLELKRVEEKLRYYNSPHPALLYYSSNAEFWDAVVEDYRKEYTSRNPKAYLRGRRRGPMEYWCGEGFLILRWAGRTRLLTYEQLQMIQDTCLARENVYAALSVRMHNGSDDLAKHLEDIISWQEECIRRYGNDGYELVKAPEAMYKAWLNTLSQGDILVDSSFHRTTRKIRDKELKMATYPAMTYRLESLCRRTLVPGDCMELFGLIKISGHPTVYAEKSASGVQKEAKPYLSTSPLSIFQSLRCFKHTILTNYIQQETDWPPFRTAPKIGTLLHRHWQSRTTALPVGSYPLSDLDHIEFGKFLEFDYSQDFLKFLDDKAISPGGDQTHSFWFGGAQKPKRLLIAALQTEQLDMHKIVERLRRRGFKLEEMVIELTQKERELKPAARCFCKLPLEVRCFFALTEYNLGEQLMKKYLPQQTMTMSNTETRQRLHGIATTGATRSQSGFLEVDFSRWNLRWRSRTVNPIARVIEDIFGLPGAYTQGHWFFSHATVVLTDRHTLPAGVRPGVPVWEWPLGPLVWTGHLGGFEGILQKLWTICTICMILAALLGLPLSFLMAGQGDNQILAIVPSSSRVNRRRLFVDVLSNLDLFCKSLGHDVKPEECIDSSTVISYSKEFYVKGVHHMYTLKFASRTLRRDDSDVPSLSSEIAGICATATAVSDTLEAPLRAWWWQAYRLRRYFRSRKNTVDSTPSERRMLREILGNQPLYEYLSCLPGSLGGLPIQSHTRFRIKGEVDDLIWDVCAIKLLGHRIRGLSQHLAKLIDGGYLPHRIDMSQLIIDPRSIPLDRPPDQRRLIKNAIRGCLPSLVRNTWIKEIVNTRVTEVGEQLIKTLTSMRPMYPQIAQDIFSASLAGLSDSIYGRFTMTRTIKNVVGSMSFVREIKAGNVNLLRFVMRTFSSATGHRSAISPLSAYDSVRRLRMRWGIGDIQSAVGVYCPLDFPLVTDAHSTISASLRTSISSVHRSLGPYPPNFGTRTRQKRSEHGYKIMDSADTLKDIRSLVMINSELKSGPELRECISEIIQSRCPWDLPTMERYLPTSIGGTAAHRHENLQSGFFCTLGSNTVPTHINYDTDGAGILSGGEEDYPIVFQEFFLCLNNHIGVIGHCQAVSGPVTLRYRIPAVLDPIPTATCEIDKRPNAGITWPSLNPTNALAYLNNVVFSVYTSIPPASLLPYRHNGTKVDILYSAMVTSIRYKAGSLTSLRGAIIHTKDFLDIKEATRCSPHEIYLAASAAILVHSLSAAQASFVLGTTGVLDDAIGRLCTAIAPQIVKTLLHPSRREMIGVADQNILMQPGGGLQMAAVDSAAGTLVQYANLLLHSRNFTTMLPSLILGQDKLRSVTMYARMIALALLVRGLNPNGLITSHSVTSRLNRAEAFGRAAGSSVIGLSEIKTEYGLIGRDYNRGLRKKGSSHRASLPELKIYQINADQAELTRTLRNFAKLTTVVTPDPAEASGFKRNAYTGLCKLVDEPYMSTKQGLTCECQPMSSEDRARETRMGYMWKTAGKTASVRSVWNYILAQTRFPYRRFGVIGVGRGASAAALLEKYTDSSAVGLDRRESWPLITQRELSYCPPDVIRSSCSSRFEWADEVWDASGGDIFAVDLESWISKYNIDCLVVDIETDHSEITRLLSLLRTPVLLRVRLCPHQLGAVLACGDKRTRLFNISSPGTSEKQVVGLFIPQGLDFTLFPGRQATWTQFNPSLSANRRCMIDRFNDLIRPWGLNMTEASPSFMDQASMTIRRRALNSNDQDIQRSGANLAGLLERVATWSRMDISKSLPELLNDLDIPRMEARFALLHLANLQVNCHTAYYDGGASNTV